MFKYICESLASNISMILAMFFIFSICVLADILSKIFYNVHRLGESFDIRKLVTGVIRMIVIGVTTSLLGMVVTILPDVLTLIGIPISEDMKQLITIASICLIYYNGITKYFKSAYDTVNKIVNNEKIFEINDVSSDS